MLVVVLVLKRTFVPFHIIFLPLVSRLTATLVVSVNGYERAIKTVKKESVTPSGFWKDLIIRDILYIN
jgi:hypothetical protein